MHSQTVRPSFPTKMLINNGVDELKQHKKRSMVSGALHAICPTVPIGEISIIPQMFAEIAQHDRCDSPTVECSNTVPRDALSVAACCGKLTTARSWSLRKGTSPQRPGRLRSLHTCSAVQLTPAPVYGTACAVMVREALSLSTMKNMNVAPG